MSKCTKFGAPTLYGDRSEFIRKAVTEKLEREKEQNV